MAMKQHHSSQGRIRRSLRRLGLSCNPMRRPIDLIESLLRAVLLAAFLAGAPLATLSLSHATYLSGLRTQRMQALAWHPTPARILRLQTPAAAWRHPAPPLALLTVSWAGPDSAWHSGRILGAASAVTGSTTRVWIDGKGRLAHPPLSHAELTGQVIRTAVTTPLVIALLLALAMRVISLVLDKKRLARWEADWSATEPQWTSRR